MRPPDDGRWRPAVRRPGEVPDEEPGRPAAMADGPGHDVSGGVDSDRDGHPDTVLADDGTHLLLHTDLDGDGFADRTLRIGPDGGPTLRRADPADEMGANPAARPSSLVEVLVRLLRGGS